MSAAVNGLRLQDEGAAADGSSRWDVDAWAEMAAVCARAPHHVTAPSKHWETFDTRLAAYVIRSREHAEFVRLKKAPIDAQVGLVDRCLRGSDM